MPGRKWLGVNRTVIVLTLAYSVLFLVFSVISAVTYSKVTLADQQIVAENPQHIALVLENGTLFIGFKIRVSNPSPYSIHVTSINWYSEIKNTSGNPSVIPLASNYTAENVGIIVEAGADSDISLGWYVTGELLDKVNGYIAYWDARGANYTLTTAPYAHSFEFRGWLDDFKHDYFRENYLNGLVTIDLTYTYGLEG